jgi:hypothetical protein
MEDPVIELPCPSCQRAEVVITGIISAFNAPLPDVYALDCKVCGWQGDGYQDSRGWTINWEEIEETSK